MPDRSAYQKAYRESYGSRAKRVNLTFGLSECADLERAAKRSGMPLSAYVKSCALQGHSGQVEAPEDVLEQLADLSRVVRTIANNVNQMARHSNTIGQVLDEHEVFARIQELQSAYETALRDVSEGSGQAPPSGSGT